MKGKEKEKKEKSSKKKAKKEKIKIKKKNFIILLVVLFLVTIGASICLYKMNYNTTLKSIKRHYNELVISNKKINLYDKDMKVIGKLNKGVKFSLNKLEIKDLSIQYFNIKDTDLYVYYEDVKPTKKIDKIDINPNYLVLNKNVTSKNKITLYKDGKDITTFKSNINVPIQYMDNDYVYVNYFSNLYGIKKSDKIEIIDNNNSSDLESLNIPVIHFYEIAEKSENYNSIALDNAKEQISKIKENGYYSINSDEYKNYLAGNVRLKEKAIYFTTTNVNDLSNNLANELGITINAENAIENVSFKSSNLVSSKDNNLSEVNRYQVKSYSTIENILKMANGEEVSEAEPVVYSGGQGIAVLNYHFFYDPTIGEECNEGICLTVAKFRQHLDYLKNNGYKTLTMNEFTRWMYGEIELPQKSVLITIDDGAMGTGAHNGNKLIPLLEEYNMQATLFLIAGWWDIENYRSPNLTIQSHTYDMHLYGDCGRGQLVCNPYEKAYEDLKHSLEIIGNNDSFCYPFYSYSDTAIRAVKDNGFKIAFAGGSVKATRKSNKYIIPRYPIHSDITLNEFINMVS